MKLDGYTIVSEATDHAYEYAKELAKLQRKYKANPGLMKQSIDYSINKLSMKNAMFKLLPKSEQQQLMKKAHRMIKLKKAGKISAAVAIAISILTLFKVKKKTR